MKKLFLACYLLAAAPTTFGQTNSNTSYSTLWSLIAQQEFGKAEELIASGKIRPEKKHDAYITGLYLKGYLQKIDETADFIDAFYTKVENPDPYVYALWFSPPVLGFYGKKTQPHQLALIKALLDNPRTFGTIRAGALYQLGMHYRFQNKFDSAQSQFVKIGGIQNWQYVGPFENLSQSGIYKSYGPLERPDDKSEFSSLTNARIKWFTPPHENPDGWIPVSNQIKNTTAVVYTQTFVTSPADQDVIVNTGVSGAIRVWINDSMILSETTERTTEFDTYSVKCRLQKGVNRIVVQLSFTNTYYANFGMRITDHEFNPIPGLVGSSFFKPYKKSSQSPSAMKHFAEDFFANKIEAEPDNMVNYLLLSDVYLRHKKILEARKLIESAIRIFPNNLLRAQLTEILAKEENQTVLLEEVDNIRRSDPKSPMILEIDISNSINTERYTEALDAIAEYEKRYGQDLKTLKLKMGVLGKQNRIPELVDLAEQAFKLYPDEPELIPLMFAIRKEINRDKAAAMRIYEVYLRQNHNYTVLSTYLELLHEEGNSETVTKKRKWMVETSPHETLLLADLAEYHMNAEEYAEAGKCLEQAIALSPYDGKLWDLIGDAKRGLDKKEEAIQAFQRSLELDPNQYTVITKLRTLLGKPEIYTIVPEANIEQIIANDTPPESSQTSNKGYYIVFQDRSTVMHPAGATEDFHTYILRITNEKGIKAYKESTINYNSSQNLFIEQFDLIKPSGVRIRGERNQNQIVFPNLEVGDVIVYRYRYQNFFSGRFANDFWTKHFFQKETYLAHSRYSILLPASRKLNYVVSNSTLQPKIQVVDEFKQYSWEMKKQPPYADESYRPAVVDVVPVLHISTLATWNDVAFWYADLINKSSDETYELTSAFQNIFGERNLKAMTEFEKAKAIYSYIVRNVRYSSVSFRQGAYLPQTASKTLATRLGDCKDLSNLFMKLCEMAGVTAQMVLTDTRDHGEMDMVLPSIDFNHCIAKAKLDGKDFFIELTDNHLPFASLPINLTGALILEIPRDRTMGKVELTKLDTRTKTRAVAKASVTMRPLGNDLFVDVNRIKYGQLTSKLRNDFSSIPYDKQILKLRDYVASQNKEVNIDTLVFGSLDSLDDSVSFAYRYQIKDGIAEIASMSTFKLIFPDLAATSSHFASAKREYPIDYPAYEDTDYYETTIRVEIPPGKKFVEVPANVSLTFNGMSYDLQYSLVEPEMLIVTRKFNTQRTRIDVKDYSDMKAFLDMIVKSEQRILAVQ